MHQLLSAYWSQTEVKDFSDTGLAFDLGKQRTLIIHVQYWGFYDCSSKILS